MIDQETITGSRRALGLRLAAFRQAAGYRQHDFASLVHYSRSSVANVETGRQKATPEFWRRCDEVLGTGGVLAAGYDDLEAKVLQRRHDEARLSIRPVAPSLDDTARSVRGRVARAARESQLFLAQWDSRCLGPQTVEEFAEDLSRLSAQYVYRPLDGLFDELVAVRDRAWALLVEQRRMSDTRGLLFVAGLACGMLAHASVDLGDRRAGAHQARAAGRLAAEAGHDGLLGWVYGTQSLIAYCLGLPDKAVEFAERGRDHATSTEGKVRLAALKARGCAAGRDIPAARQALVEARAAREGVQTRDDLDDIGGILTFSPAKQHYYAASTAALLSDGTAAEVHARAAIADYETSPEELCSYGDLALTRVYLAQAWLLKPKQRQDPAAAGEALEAVLTLPREKRIAGLRWPLRRVCAELDREPVRHSAEARQLRTRIDGFLGDTRVLAPT